MSKVITDEKLIDKVLTRGVENIFPSREELKKVLMSGKRIRLYCGYDTTSETLHIGNAISINKLGQFQKLGHEVIFLIGDFTGMIGDPTDKSAARKKLTKKKALENSKNYQKQSSGYLKFEGENSAKVLYNSEWSSKLTFDDVIEASSNFTVQQMLQRDMFQQRLKEEKPIYLHEFLYPLAQGYDSVAMDVDLEIGGNDQMFNMLCGRDLMKTLKGKEKFVLTMKILADESGKKMGKTEGNGVDLNETPENMFGQIMAWSDGLIIPGFELCTNLDENVVAEIKEKMKDSGNNPRDFKLQLAYEITKINHGEDIAKLTQENFIKTFSKKEIPDEVREFTIEDVGSKSSADNVVLTLGSNGHIKIVDFLVNAGMATSNSDARRKIEQGGVEIDGNKIEDWKFVLDKDFDGKVMKVGKKDFVRIKF